MARKTSTSPLCKVVILTACPEEWKAARTYLQKEKEIVHPSGTIYYQGTFLGEHHLWDVAIALVGVGGIKAAIETEKALSYWQARMALSVGTAGGLKNVRLGDVVVGTKIYAYESGRAAKNFEPRPEVWEPSHALVQRAQDEALRDTWLTLLDRTQLAQNPCVHFAPLASGGSVIGSRQTKLTSLLQSTYGDALAVEMEGHGFLQAIQANHSVHSLVLRGIANLLDDKVESEAMGWKPIAAQHAVAFTFQILTTFQFPPDMKPARLSKKSLPEAAVSCEHADENHFKLLGRGVASWNAWRQRNREIKPNLRGCYLHAMTLTDIDFSDTDLSGANLSLAILDRADLSRANLSDANLYGVNLSRAVLEEANLQRANLNEADLPETLLSNAHLMSINANYTVISGANLRNANLCLADLYHANLSRADLSGALLTMANLKNADLRETNLSRVSMNQANLHEAIFAGTILASIDLCETQGVEKIVHAGPSLVQFHTVTLSPTSINAFLRGVGVPDLSIEHYYALMASPQQYPSLFICSADQDYLFAYRLYDDLQKRGIRCWFEPQNLRIGDKKRTCVDEAIYSHDLLLLILSTASVANYWVHHQFEMALTKENKQAKIILLPLCIDRTLFDKEDLGWPVLARLDRHISDFTNWTNSQLYQQAFEQLLRDLRRY